MPKRKASRVARPPAGRAVLRAEVSALIQRAALTELAGKGYRGMSMEGVARRAGVGKAALYRRWPSKQVMIATLVADWGAEAADTADTGTLAGDVETFLTATLAWFEDPQTARIFADLVAEGQRDQKLAAVLRAGLQQRRRSAAEEMFQRARTRRELPPDADIELALDLMAAPVFWRAVVTRGTTSGRYVRMLTDALLRALGARPPR